MVKKKIKKLKKSKQVRLKKSKQVRLKNNLVLIYDKVEKIWCQKGKNSNYPNLKFEHTFKTKPRLYGLPDGSLLILPRKKGQRLWKYFSA